MVPGLGGSLAGRNFWTWKQVRCKGEGESGKDLDSPAQLEREVTEGDGDRLQVMGPSSALRGQGMISLVPGMHLAPSRPNPRLPSLCSNWPPHQGHPFPLPLNLQECLHSVQPSWGVSPHPIPTRLRGLPIDSINQTTLS